MYYQTIGQYLEHIVRELEDELDGKESLDSVMQTMKESGNIPLGCTRVQGLLYCLKYHFEYAFEYEYIYTNHIIKYFKGMRMNVMSLGCGNGIDLWSLCHALARSDADIASISYTGIDRNICRELFCGRREDSVRYRRDSSGELRRRQLYEGTDVLFLPRSAGMIRRDELDKLAKHMSEGTKRLYIAASFRSSGDQLDADINHFDYLIDRLEKNGLHLTEGRRNKYFRYSDEEVCGIKSIYHDYEYPDRALTLLERLGRSGSVGSSMPVLTNRMLRYNYAVMEGVYN